MACRCGKSGHESDDAYALGFAAGSAAHSESAPVDDRLRSIQEYVYAKYIDGSGAPPIDEVEAAEFLEQYFGQAEHVGDADCFYPGILYFELGFEMEERQSEFFQRAKYWLERYKTLSGGEEWDAIDDRLADVDDFLESEGIEFEAPDLPDAPVAPITIQEVEDHGVMVLVSGGPFRFGEEGETLNIPAYYIDKFPVTNRQYEAFCRATGYRFPKYWNDKRFNQPDAPVVGVSLADAQKYSRWVGKHLPSEEQWEKACRGVDGRELPWGDEDDFSAERACYGRDPLEGSTDPVTGTSASASPFGARDLIGNVWEWTTTSVNDGETVNVIKGGCYNDEARFLFASLRLGAVPKDKFEAIGFRCVKSA